MLRALILSISLLVLGTGSAFAQPPANTAGSAPVAARQEPGGNNTRLMLGFALKETITPGDQADNTLGVSLIWRWRGRSYKTNDRFAFAYRMGSFSTDISSNVGQFQNVELGRARIRPLMVGVDYKMPRGKWNWSAGITGGWSLNSIKTEGAVRDRLFSTVGDTTSELRDSIAVSPRIKGWYDVNRRVSFMVESGYTFARPELRIRTSGFESRQRINADAFIVKAGIVYGVW